MLQQKTFHSSTLFCELVVAIVVGRVVGVSVVLVLVVVARLYLLSTSSLMKRSSLTEPELKVLDTP